MLAAMKRVPARLLQLVVVLAALGVLAFLLVEPLFEGRNAHASLFQVYFDDPFLAFAYLGSIAFFVAAYQAFRLLGFAGRHGAFPPTTGDSLRLIRACAFTLLGFVAVGELYILLHESDDRAGGVAMGLLIACGCAAVATAATLLERRSRA
jgi:hypothetical protein